MIMANAAEMDANASAPPMVYRNLGRSGLKVSALSFGNWVTVGKANRQVQEDQLFDIMSAAFSAGINYFDTAEAYAGGEAGAISARVLIF